MDPNFRPQAFGSPQRRMDFFDQPQMYGYMPMPMFYPMMPQQPQPLMFMNPYAIQASAIKAPSPRNHPLLRLPTALPQHSGTIRPEIQVPERYQQTLDLNLALPISKLLNRDYSAISEFKYSGNQIGAYDVTNRRVRIERYRQKRKELNFKQVRYQSRASICQKRERVGGRFVKTSEVIRADATTKRQRRSDQNSIEQVGRNRKLAQEDESASSIHNGSSSPGPSTSSEDENEAGSEESQVVQSILKLKSRQ